MLPYPFFGCQGHEFPTQIVVDLYLSLLCAAAYGVIGGRLSGVMAEWLIWRFLFAPEGNLV